MNSFELINMTFAGIEEKITSELFTVKSIFEMTYDSPNYRSHVVHKLRDEIFNEIDELPLNEHLIKKITFLINSIKARKEDDQLLKAHSRTSRAQKSHIEFLISELSSLIVCLENDLSKIAEDSSSGVTCLSRKETCLLFRYLQLTNAILNHEQISDRKLVENIGALTKISKEQIRKEYLANPWNDMSEFAANRENYDKLKVVLGNIIDKITSDAKAHNYL